MNAIKTLLFLCFFLLQGTLLAQKLTKSKFEEIKRRISFQGTEIQTEILTFQSYTFKKNGVITEAILVKPRQVSGKMPSIILLPDFGKTAIDYLPRATKWAKKGFVCVSVSLVGSGRSNGKPDFMGTKTINPLKTLVAKLKKEPFVDEAKIGIYGYSQGAMAASLLIADNVKIKAAVLIAGIYDFKEMYLQTEDENLQTLMLNQAGLLKGSQKKGTVHKEFMTSVIKQRSSLLNMKKVDCFLLLLHGKNDKIVPVTQTQNLKTLLDKNKKLYESHIFEDKGHSLGKEHQTIVLDFFKRKLK